MKIPLLISGYVQSIDHDPYYNYPLGPPKNEIQFAGGGSVAIPSTMMTVVAEMFKKGRRDVTLWLSTDDSPSSVTILADAIVRIDADRIKAERKVAELEEKLKEQKKKTKLLRADIRTLLDEK